LITFNSIHSNLENGIDLTAGEGTWFTPNDPGDIDLGPNDFMNYPVLNHASTTGVLLLITGEIADGLPNTTFEIQFFANDVCDSPGGHGEGKTYLGSSTENTNGSGNISFLTSFGSGVTGGQFITATATSGSKTSEFSACVEVTDTQTYSQDLDDELCGQFGEEELKMTTFEVDPDLLAFNFYLKKPSAYPGSEDGSDDDLVYTAFVGDIEARYCNFQGFADRLYCQAIVPLDYLGSSKKVEVFFNICGPSIHVNEEVTIFGKAPTPRCTEDLSRSDCPAAGGVYDPGDDSCDCP
jgi:hypothetical protein